MRAITAHPSRAHRLSRLAASATTIVCVSVLAALGSACAPAAQPDGEAARPVEGGLAAIPPGFEGLNPTLWVQTSVEYRGLASQAYLQARGMLDQALADSSWTAALEQTDAYSELPVAVILDIDETVLNNSFYQARLTVEGEAYAPASWDEWVQESAAAPVPGALEFCQYAASKGVTVFYVTNRNSHLEDATRANLEHYELPFQEGVDTLLLRGERPEWDTGDKGPRRTEVASGYRIVLLIGDNMGDFVSASSGTVAERQAFADQHPSWFGTRWITLPNPQYGSWEGAVLDFDFSQPLEQQRQTKIDALDPLR
jgi:5'-nucleotidase (lipoprotein e(P4) family)